MQVGEIKAVGYLVSSHYSQSKFKCSETCYKHLQDINDQIHQPLLDYLSLVSFYLDRAHY